MTEPKTAAKAAFARAQDLESELLERYPAAWEQLDALRANPPASWPDWCLLPMAAAAAVATGGAPTPLPIGMADTPIAAIAALYAWRFSRSAWLIDDRLAHRLITQVPDAWGLETVRALPQWCVYLWSPAPDQSGSGLWMHLEHDVNTGRPELRLLLDPGFGGLDALLPIPIYLDRPTLTEALADFRATTAATLGPVARHGQDVHGGAMDDAVADLADRVDTYLAIAAYLCRPEADIRHASRPGRPPVRPRRPMRDQDVWLIGSADASPPM
jgi:hypothetical protein